jgi:AraC family transcriptional regulator of arabinose operon
MRAILRFFIPPPIETTDLTISGIGIMQLMKSCVINRPQGTGDYLFMMFPRSVIIRHDGEDRWFERDTMVIWSPGSEHVYGNPTLDYVHSWIHCDGKRIAALLDMVGVPVNQPFTLTDSSVVDRSLWDIYREVTMHATPSADIVANVIHSWLADMKRQITGDASAIPSSMLSVVQYMGENLDQKLTLAMLADHANLSASHFSARFKQSFGLSPIDYLIELRMHTAANLLKDRSHSVAEVARTVGYEDPFHFSKQFKVRFGINPSHVRKGAY